MAKSKGAKWYAIRKGTQGRKIVATWEECSGMVTGFPGAVFKSFPTEEEAKSWLGNYDAPIMLSSPAPSPVKKQPDNEIIALSPSPSKSNRYSPYPARAPQDSPVERSHRFAVAPPKNSSSQTAPASSVVYASNASSPPVASTSKLPQDMSIDAIPGLEEGPPAPPPVQLNEQQAGVLRMVRAGENVFVTGSAGTGKSVLTREIIKTLNADGRKTYITASTGIAGVNIGGSTLHSFAGLGLAKEPKEKCLGKLLGQYGAKARRRWNECQALIIDEISMIDGELFDKLEFVARKIRGKEDQPFGGIQLITTGDFFQLLDCLRPPVGKKGEKVPLFAFQATSWKKCFGRNMVNLTQVFRQKSQDFVDMLNEMRSGKLTDQTIKSFSKLRRDVTYESGAAAVQLYPVNYKVQGANETQLRKLQGGQRSFQARDYRGVYLEHDNMNKMQKDQKTTEKLDKDTMAVSQLLLKEGAQVMLIKNLAESRLVNGSIGKVIGFKSAAQAQGQEDEMDLEIAQAQEGSKKNENEWTGSMAASRTKNGKEKEVPAGVWPVVEFENGCTMLCPPMEFAVENADSKLECQRSQVPLILSWALSIHKSQGQTIERVFIDLTGVFEKGQAYVALSRATSMDTLTVKGFTAATVQAHPIVTKWYAETFG